MTSTFALFPRLPCELRLQVWEFALRPFSAHKGGINYVYAIYEADAADADTKPLTIASWSRGIEKGIERKEGQFLCNRAQNGVSSDPSHRSACLWDSGLLTACWESRDVIMRRCKKYQQSTQPSRWAPYWPSYYEEPSILHATDQDEDWYILCQRYKDIPCFTFPNWELLSKDESTEVGVHKIPLHDMCEFHGAEIVFALEFDASWILNWPKNDFDIFDEASPRGYIARLLREYVRHPGASVCLIWLMDRKAAPWETSESLEIPCRIFYDMDHDYVESIYMSEEVSEFRDKLDILITGWQDLPSIGFLQGWADDEWFHIDECVNVLVPVCGK
jgi:hypothetical protein